MRVQNSFFQVYWDWKIIVSYLAVCSHSPFSGIWIPSLGGSLRLTTWMKSSARAHHHLLWHVPQMGQLYKQPTPLQTEGRTQDFVRSAGELPSALQGFDQSMWWQQGTHPSQEQLLGCRWRQPWERRQVQLLRGGRRWEIYLFAVSKKAFTTE